MKLKHAASAVAIGLLALGVHAQEAAPEEGEKVVITGQRPGPGLWKVSKGEHVMYVFGEYSPLPVKMEWRSHEIEAVLAKSQEYLARPSFGVSVGWWGGLKMLPFAIGFKDNPDGGKLIDVLPAETYDRWQLLKAKYIGKDSGIERERPMFAAQTLYERGLEKNGLTTRTGVNARLEKLAKEHNVKITRSGVQVELDNPGDAVKAFKKSAGADTACFVKTVDNLETDLDAMRVRANAWAVGDMSKITSLSFAEREDACKDAFLNNDAVKSNAKLRELEQAGAKNWMANAERALENNNTTFAVLSLARILDPKGPLAELKAKGYRVEAPE